MAAKVGVNAYGLMYESCRTQDASTVRKPKVSVTAAIADTAVAARQSNLMLQDVRVVLTSPKSPGNIGSVARCAENFEVSDLWVVDPRCDPRDGEAHMLACGSPLMDTMTTVPTLQEALANTSASIGFTRRVGNTRLVHASLSQLLQAFPNTLPDLATARDSSWASEGRVALVFGREESGLTANELSLCTHSCSILSGPVQPSLNLSHAVCVILAQLFEQRTCNHDAGVRTVHFTCLSLFMHCCRDFQCMHGNLPLPSSGSALFALDCECITFSTNGTQCWCFSPQPQVA
ncbi:TPA: hypothetical protein ACH3X1_001866 [Trebouxia sp. C0004]